MNYLTGLPRLTDDEVALSEREDLTPEQTGRLDSRVADICSRLRQARREHELRTGELVDVEPPPTQ